MSVMLRVSPARRNAAFNCPARSAIEAETGIRSSPARNARVACSSLDATRRRPRRCSPLMWPNAYPEATRPAEQPGRWLRFLSVVDQDRRVKKRVAARLAAGSKRSRFSSLPPAGAGFAASENAPIPPCPSPTSSGWFSSRQAGSPLARNAKAPPLDLFSGPAPRGRRSVLEVRHTRQHLWPAQRVKQCGFLSWP